MTEVPEPSAAIKAVRAQLEEFLSSFRNLELERFLSLWNDNPSVFHPFAQAGKRLIGKEAVRAGWVALFEGVRESQLGPPYLDLDVRDVDIQPIGSNVAVVTFHLHLPEAVGRRTLVFELQPGGWQIAHLHASNVERAM